jgi:hypothetical protein
LSKLNFPSKQVFKIKHVLEDQPNNNLKLLASLSFSYPSERNRWNDGLKISSISLGGAEGIISPTICPFVSTIHIINNYLMFIRKPLKFLCGLNRKRIEEVVVNLTIFNKLTKANSSARRELF